MKRILTFLNKGIEKIYDFIHNKQLVISVAFLSSYFLIRSWLWESIGQVPPVLVIGSLSSFVVTVLFCITFFVLTINFLKKYNHGYNRKKRLTGVLLVSLVYFLEREVYSDWVFSNVFQSPFYYFDVIFVWLFYESILYFRKNPSLPEADDTESFIQDELIEELEQDLFHYDSHAKSLAPKIINSRGEKAFSIGILGKWGSGKSTFIKLLKPYLQVDHIIQIDFNAWRSVSHSGITKDFFDLLSKSLTPYKSDISNLINKYVENLTKIDGSKSSKFIKMSFDSIFLNKGVENQYHELGEFIESLNKHIVIFIDDIDRLDKEEIFEIFKIVRNTANFPNTTFVLAYDKGYVLQAISKRNSYQAKNYIEKIVQTEISLPVLSPNRLLEALKKRLEDKLPTDNQKDIDKEFDNAGTIPYFYIWFSNIREVNRFVNSFFVSHSKLQNEVSFSDLFRLEILKVYFPLVFDLIGQNEKSFFTTKQIDDSTSSSYLVLSQDENKKYTLIEYLKNDLERFQINASELERIITLLQGIFPDRTSMFSGFFKNTNPLAISNPSNFERYFRFGLTTFDISNEAFNKYLNKGIDSIYEYLYDLVKEGHWYEVFQKCLSVEDYKSKNEFETYIALLFKLGGTKYFQDGKESNYFPINYEDLKKRLYLSKVRINTIYGDEDSYEEFVKSMFENAKSPYYFESSVLRSLREKSFVDLPLNKEQAKEYVNKYFLDYIAKAEKLDQNVWNLFYACKEAVWTTISSSTKRQDGFVIDQEVKKPFLNFIVKKDVKSFLIGVTSEDPFNKGSFRIINEVEDIFDSFSNFKKWLDDLDSESFPFVKEYILFYSKFEGDFEMYKKFEFKKLVS